DLEELGNIIWGNGPVVTSSILGNSLQQNGEQSMVDETLGDNSDFGTHGYRTPAVAPIRPLVQASPSDFLNAFRAILTCAESLNRWIVAPANGLGRSRQ